ncbi:hypothetical protein, partial [Thiocapsa sp. N5-Cardenillas]|uniref:hypothetical protein n=1 Tax=Thiocapsa sp. N5-Cardenillas TaxID=3137397 RepID=UPI0035AE62DE
PGMLEPGILLSVVCAVLSGAECWEAIGPGTPTSVGTPGYADFSRHPGYADFSRHLGETLAVGVLQSAARARSGD